MNFTIEQVANIPIDQFGLNEFYYDISFSNVDLTFEEAISLVETMVFNLVEMLRSKMEENDKIALTFDHSQFFTPISIPFVKKKYFTYQLVVDQLVRVTQSYKDLAINPRNSLNAIAQIQKIPIGAGRRALPLSEKKNTLKRKKHLNKSPQFLFQKIFSQKQNKKHEESC